MNWKQKIEAQIDDLKDAAFLYSGDLGKELNAVAASLQALLDVAVAADTYLVDVQHDESEQALFDALDKLKEMSSED